MLGSPMQQLGAIQGVWSQIGPETRQFQGHIHSARALSLPPGLHFDYHSSTTLYLLGVMLSLERCTYQGKSYLLLLTRFLIFFPSKTYSFRSNIYFANDIVFIRTFYEFQRGRHDIVVFFSTLINSPFICQLFVCSSSIVIAISYYAI